MTGVTPASVARASVAITPSETLRSGEVDGAATLLPLEVEVELALCHSGDVGQDEVDGGVGAIRMVHDTVVAVDLFAWKVVPLPHFSPP